MIDIILDTLIDAIKLIPFLFLVFLLMEYIEHKIKEKNKKKISTSGKLGPLIGSLLGIVPQCGFSAAATNLYVTRVISLGTLISIYLSTSDEMIPIMIANKVSFKFILYVLLFKFIIGMIIGFIIDFIYRKKEKESIKDFCHEEHCHCESSIFNSSIKHTLNILLFIVIVEFILNSTFYYLGTDTINKIFMNNTIFGSLLTSLFGLIPNCASSVIITELFINETIKFGSLIGGLLTNAGVGLLILFKVNKNIKENISIIILLYLVGSICGLIINLIGVL